jgi:hypothetical protein
MSNEHNDTEPASEIMQHHREKQPMSREEYFERIKPYIVQGGSFRLEMIYDAEKDIFIIQGDENGLKRFGESVLSAAHREKAGYDSHWDESTTTFINVQEIIVRRVDSYEDTQSPLSYE